MLRCEQAIGRTGSAASVARTGAVESEPIEPHRVGRFVDELLLLGASGGDE
jgi:hypothetical protein